MCVELKRNTVAKEPCLYIVMQYDVRLHQLPRQIRTIWKEFRDGNSCIHNFVSEKLTLSWKRGKNIRETGVRAALPPIAPVRSWSTIAKRINTFSQNVTRALTR